jgi:hypothetical protein
VASPVPPPCVATISEGIDRPSINRDGAQSREFGITQPILEGRQGTRNGIPQAARGVEPLKQWARNYHVARFCPHDAD